MTPNIDAATSGLPSSTSGGVAVAMPAIAAAALDRMRADTALIPAMSTTE